MKIGGWAVTARYPRGSQRAEERRHHLVTHTKEPALPGGLVLRDTSENQGRLH